MAYDASETEPEPMTESNPDLQRAIGQIIIAARNSEAFRLPGSKTW
jgi:hypothetical protein